ncbi:hypothetical protein D3C80_2215550 [compost metagenome]
MADIHHRMPVILAPEQFSLWLSPARTSPPHPVSSDVGNNRNDYPELIVQVKVVLAV